MEVVAIIRFIMCILSNLLFLSIIFSERVRGCIKRIYIKIVKIFIKCRISRDTSKLLACVTMVVFLLIIVFIYDRLIYNSFRLFI